MVDILSPRDGPRPQDTAAKAFIDQNRATITGLADQLTRGGYSASQRDKKAREAEAQQARIIAESTPSLSARYRDTGQVQVKVAVNNRVVAYDTGSGRQILMLGEIRHLAGQRYFAYATKENGFFTLPPEDVTEKLQELDGQIIDAACPEKLLAQEIAERLGMTAS